MKKMVKMPSHGGGGLIFLNWFKIQSFEFEFVFVSDPENSESGTHIVQSCFFANIPSLLPTLNGFSPHCHPSLGLKQVLPATLANMLGGIAHVTPRFYFRDISYKNRFFTPGGLAYDVVLAIIYEVLKQW